MRDFKGTANRMSLPPELRSPNTISQVVEDSVKHCHATKFCCCKLKKCVEKSRRQFSSTCCNNEMLLTMFEVSGNACNNVFQLATQHVVPVEEKCCPYYFTFSTNHATIVIYYESCILISSERIDIQIQKIEAEQQQASLTSFGRLGLLHAGYNRRVRDQFFVLDVRIGTCALREPL